MSVDVLAVVQDLVREVQSIITNSVNNTANQVIASIQDAIQQLILFIQAINPLGGFASLTLNTEWLESIEVIVLASALDVNNVAQAACLPPLA